MKLGIIGAMQVEVEILLSVLENKKETTVAGSTFYEGQLEGTEVAIVQCGVGKVNAAICAQILCDCFHVTHLVNTGIAFIRNTDASGVSGMGVIAVIQLNPPHSGEVFL